ncbi:hypothetical protein GCM10023339_05780 [Alloalcanivorax gelatiniphagus]
MAQCRRATALGPLRASSPAPTRTRALTASLALALAIALAASACGADLDAPRSPRSPGPADGAGSAAPRDTVPEPRLHELRGTTPEAVEGEDGYLFIGTDFDLGCGSGAEFETYLDNLGRLATVIADSGRDVVWTVVPDKSTTLVDRLPAKVPQGACFRQHQAWQEHLLDSEDDAYYVDTLEILRDADRAGEQVYWRGDSHWTSYGASLWLLEVLERLDPSVVDALEVVPGEVERTGDRYVMAERDDVETAPSTSFTTGNTVESVRGAKPFDPGAEQWGSLEWRNVPGDGVVEGRTLLIGDSFSYAGVDLAIPVLERGAFAWFQYSTRACSRDRSPPPTRWSWRSRSAP